MINRFKGKVRQLKNRIRNFFYYGWKLKDSHNWDYVYLYQIIHIKIQAMYDCMVDGICISNERDSNKMRKMLEASLLAKRLSEFEYDSSEHRDSMSNRLFYLVDKYITYWWD